MRFSFRATLAVGMALLLASSGTLLGAGEPALLEVGAAKVDITPNYPIRLAGYAARKTECEGVAQHIFARALAIGSDKDKPAVLVAVDTCGMPRQVREAVVRHVHKQYRLDPNRIAICSTHTHSAPWLHAYLSNLFAPPVSAEEDEHSERYTRELTAALEKVIALALADRKPAWLAFGKGKLEFAANRRTPGGPSDHDLPFLIVKSAEGQVRAILGTYACHCTTLTGEFNKICGDWAGYAAEELERKFPGAVPVITIGCGGDANPSPRPGFELAKQHGAAFASAMGEVIGKDLTPVSGTLRCRIKTIQLAYDKLPTRAEWEAQAKGTDHNAQRARANLERLDRGEKLPRSLAYIVQTWSFGDKLAWVFLPGEVVVDYSLRFKRDFDPSRSWVVAYANDVPCYIPSERVLREGGYEGGGAMVYYDRPAKFAPGIEENIFGAVRQLVPKAFRNQTNNQETRP